MFDTLRGGGWITPKRLRAYPLIFLLAYLGACAYFLPKATGILLPGGLMVGTDFLSVYAAADLAAHGEPELAYEDAPHLARMRAIAASPEAPGFLWSYPPPFLMAVAPLASLSYLSALGVSLAVTGALCWFAYRLVDPPKQWWVAAVAFPAVFINLWHGQNGFLSAAFMGLALYWLPRRPWLAGLAAGLLAFKPQLAVLFPIVFLASGMWKAFVGMAITGVAAAGASYAMWGVGVWQAFVGGLNLARTAMLEFGASGYWKMISLQALARALGVPPSIAAALQAVLSLAIAVALALAWRRYGHRWETCALTVLAVLLATPYSHTYDMVMLGWVILWMVLARRESGFLPWEKSLLALLWLLPLFHFLAGSATQLPLGALALAAAFVHVWRTLWQVDPPTVHSGAT